MKTIPTQKKTKAKPSDAEGRYNVVVKAINKKFQADVADTMEADTSPVIGWVKTGLWPLDWAISDFRGIPLGRGMTVWGPQGVGKSSLCDYLMKRFQDRDAHVIRFDFDDAIDKDILLRLGIDLQKIVVPDVGTLEEGFDAIQAAVEAVYGPYKLGRSKKKKKGEKVETDAKELPPMLIVWDSIPTATPKDVAEADTAEKKGMDPAPKAYSIQLKRMRLIQRNRPVTVVFTNEVRDDMNAQSWGGTPIKQPGGKAILHYPTTILKLQYRKIDKSSDDRPRGMIVYGVAEKARLGRMGRKFSFYISFSREKGKGGPSRVETNYLFLKDNKLLKPCEGGVKIRGLENLGSFTRKSFAEFMGKHEKKIVLHLKETLCQDKPVEMDDMDDDMNEE